jgi:hypothetical protein
MAKKMKGTCRLKSPLSFITNLLRLGLFFATNAGNYRSPYGLVVNLNKSLSALQSYNIFSIYASFFC